KVRKSSACNAALSVIRLAYASAGRASPAPRPTPGTDRRRAASSIAGIADIGAERGTERQRRVQRGPRVLGPAEREQRAIATELRRDARTGRDRHGAAAGRREQRVVGGEGGEGGVGPAARPRELLEDAGAPDAGEVAVRCAAERLLEVGAGELELAA